jgi:hypothetical protein
MSYYKLRKVKMKHYGVKFSLVSVALVVVVLTIGSAAPCSLYTLTANFLPCYDNGTVDPADDYFIADFTTTFSDPPATGDIALDVGGVTYSTSTIGLGTQFQFLSIPLSADGLPVQATIRFTADSACALTQTVGTAPGPCSFCTTDADCDDGIFCNGTETCDIASGTCAAVSACPPFVDGCIIRNSICDESADQCLDELDDSLCPEDKVCTTNGSCAIPGDVGSSECRVAQERAQAFWWLGLGGAWPNPKSYPKSFHGMGVSSAAKEVSRLIDAGYINQDCGDCIIPQLAKKKLDPAQHEPCGPVESVCGDDYCQVLQEGCILGDNFGICGTDISAFFGLGVPEFCPIDCGCTESPESCGVEQLTAGICYCDDPAATYGDGCPDRCEACPELSTCGE